MGWDGVQSKLLETLVDHMILTNEDITADVFHTKYDELCQLGNNMSCSHHSIKFSCTKQNPVL